METLLIGMLLAFILGATTAILPLWLYYPNIFKRLQPQAFPTPSVSVEKQREKSIEEIKKEQYLDEFANMMSYDGRAQEGEKVEKR